MVHSLFWFGVQLTSPVYLIKILTKVKTNFLLRINLLTTINSVWVRLVQRNQIVWCNRADDLYIPLSSRERVRRSWCSSCRKYGRTEKENCREEHIVKKISREIEKLNFCAISELVLFCSELPTYKRSKSTLFYREYLKYF